MSKCTDWFKETQPSPKYDKYGEENLRKGKIANEISAREKDKAEICKEMNRNNYKYK